MILANNQHLKSSCPSILKKFKSSHGYRRNNLRRVSKRLLFLLDPLCVWYVYICMYVCLCLHVYVYECTTPVEVTRSQWSHFPPCMRQGLLFITAYGKLTGSQLSVMACFSLHVSIRSLELQMLLPCMALPEFWWSKLRSSLTWQELYPVSHFQCT